MTLALRHRRRMFSRPRETLHLLYIFCFRTYLLIYCDIRRVHITSPTMTQQAAQPGIQEQGMLDQLNIDLLLKVANVTFLHPFVAWMIPLCLRAQEYPMDCLSMQASIGYASALTLLYFLEVLNKLVAYTKPRIVDLSEEVIVITGGASGLGLLIAEVYGMRGATVAVLDVKQLESGEARGVTSYLCDVSDKAQVAKVASQIEKEVCFPAHLVTP